MSDEIYCQKGDNSIDWIVPIIADAEADLEAEILARLSENDSAASVHVDVRYLPADGVTSAGEEIVYGVNSARVNG